MKVQILIVMILSFLIFLSMSDNSSLQKPLTNDYYNYISINQIKMWVSNNGTGAHDPYTDGSGFYWPGGDNGDQTAIFMDGLVWGGIVDDSIRFNGNTHRRGLQTGKILPGGNADNPDLSKYRVYKIRKNWETLPQGPERDAYERDYNEWPIEDGAPWDDVDDNGIYSDDIDRPLLVGDEILWYVTNDLDTARSTFTYGSLPIGLEFQTLVYGFDTTNYLKNVVFKRYLIINKGINTIDSLYFGYWSDSDLGSGFDDAFGCDTSLQLGFTYNGEPEDSDYSIPPAVGHMLLHGPIVQGTANDSARFMGIWHWGVKNLGMSAFSGQFEWGDFWHPAQGNYIGSKQYYNFMTGYTLSGIPFTDPFTEKITKFLIPGDPVLESEGGWHYLNWPHKTLPSPHPMDVQSLLSTGPITMAPGETQEVEISYSHCCWRRLSR